MDLSSVKALTIPEGIVKKIELNGVTLWEEPASYTNHVFKAIDTDGSIYNNIGYMDGYRLSSSGVAKALATSTVTGYIPVRGGDVIRIYGSSWYNTEHSLNYICAYDSSFNFIGAKVSSGTSYSTKIVFSLIADEDNAIVTLADLDTIAYIRVSSCGISDTSYPETGEDMIITVNEEIQV